MPERSPEEHQKKEVAQLAVRRAEPLKLHPSFLFAPSPARSLPEGAACARAAEPPRGHARVCAGLFHIFDRLPCRNGIMPVFDSSGATSGKSRMTSTVNHNGTALTVNAYLGAAGMPVRPGRVPAVVMDGLSIDFSAP